MTIKPPVSYFALLAAGVCAAAMGSLYLQERNGMPAENVVASSILFSLCGFLLFMSPGSKATLTHQLEHWSLTVRAAQGLKLVFLKATANRYQPLLASGLGYAFTTVCELLQQVLARHLPLKWQMWASWAAGCSALQYWLRQLALCELLGVLPLLVWEVGASWWRHQAVQVLAASNTGPAATTASRPSPIAVQLEDTDAAGCSLKGALTPGSPDSVPDLIAKVTVPLQPQGGWGDTVLGGSPSLAEDAAAHEHGALLAGSFPSSHTGSLTHPLYNARYQSRLAANYKVCLKLDTSLPTSALPPEMGKHMQEALSSLGPAMHISHISVRPGCIMLSLDLRQVGQQEASSSSACDMAEALLDKVQSVLGSMATDGQPPVQQATVQLGSRLFTATWDCKAQAWQVEECAARAGPSSGESSSSSSSSSEAECANPWLGVAVPGMLSLHPEATLRPAATKGHDTTITAEVQVWGMATAKAVQGWSPPPADHSAPNYTWAAPGEGGDMKLLARCKGQYLTTQVRSLAPCELHAARALAEVVVDVPAELLTTHHPGGPPSAVLLLNLELWRGEVFISETPLLAAPPPAAGGDQDAAMPWWWGAKDATMAAAVADLQACAQALKSSDVQAAAGCVPTYLRFAQDLALWLQQVRHAVRASHGCVAYAARSSSDGSGKPLPDSTLHELAGEFMRYADAAGLIGVHSMIAEQVKCLRRAAHKWLPLWTGLTGFPCHMCEQLYKEEMSALQAAGSAGLAFMGLVIMSQYILQREWASVPIPAGWGFFHVLNLVHMYKHGMKAGQPWAVASYLWRVVYQWAWVFGLVPTKATMGALAITVPWALWHVCMSVSEQVQASAVLGPTALLALSLLVDVPGGVAKATWEIQQPLLPILLSPFLVVLPRLLLEHHMRAVLASHAGRVGCTPVCSTSGFHR